MEINSSFLSGILIITVKGRVDSSTAQQFQQDVNAVLNQQQDDVAELIIDFLQLEFISSMGLRVLLTLRRKYKEMRIVNCSSAVFNVFKMTGFTSIITIEEYLPQTSLDGLTPIPGQPDLYSLSAETMIKVFPEGTTKNDVDRIVKMTKKAFVMEVPTPMTFEMKTVGEKVGLIYENITPCDVDAKTLGTLLRELHEHIIDPNGMLPSAVAKVREQIQRLMPYLGEDNAAKLKRMLSAMPEGSCLLHGNISLNKVALCGNEPVIMDLGDMCYGNSLIDLSHLYSSLSEEKRGEYFDEFLQTYYDMESSETIARNKQNIITFSVISDFTRFVTGAEPDKNTVDAALKDFEDRVANHWDELLSQLHFKMDFNEEVRKLERQRFYTDCDVNIDWVAEKLGTNRHYVSDYFNKVLHTTFSEYINNLRMKYAVELLRSGRIPTSQIPYSVGFNNDHTFRRVFKQYYGCTPSQFEKE